jgi:hypothetical protein
MFYVTQAYIFEINTLSDFDTETLRLEWSLLLSSPMPLRALVNDILLPYFSLRHLVLMFGSCAYQFI